MSYVSKIDDNWWLGAGIYENGSLSINSNETLAEGFPVNGELMWRFMQVTDAVNANLTRIDTNLAEACLSLSKTGLAGKDAENVLSNLTRTDPSVIDCITIDSNGTIIEVEPMKYQSVKGMSIRSRDHIKNLLASKRPTGFHSIMTAEGFYAVDCAAPVFNEKGEFIGASTILINATKLFSQIVGSYQPESKAKFWTMDTNGVVLYETDSPQIGKTLEDPLFKQFPEVLALAKTVIAERSGYGTYEFFDNAHQKKIRKGTFWTTVGNPEDEFRLMLTVDLE